MRRPELPQLPQVRLKDIRAWARERGGEVLGGEDRYQATVNAIGRVTMTVLVWMLAIAIGWSLKWYWGTVAIFLGASLIGGYFGVRLGRKAWLTDRLFHHTKKLTKVEQWSADKARDRQFGGDVARGDVDKVSTGGARRPGNVRSVRAGKWVKIQELPSGVWIDRDKLLRARFRIEWTPLVEAKVEKANSEVPDIRADRVGYPTDDFFKELAYCVAHFLGVPPGEVLLEAVDLWKKRVTYKVAQTSQASDYNPIYEQYGPAPREAM